MLKIDHHRRYKELQLAAARCARRFNADRIGTEHFVLALGEVEGAARDVLLELGAGLDELREGLLDLLPPSERKLFAPAEDEILGDMGMDLTEARSRLEENFGERLPQGRTLSPNTPLAAVLWLAEEQAERLDSLVVMPEHLLLAIIWHAQGRGMRLLSRFVPGPELRRRLIERLDVTQETKDRYVSECERSEQARNAIAAQRAANALPVWDSHDSAKQAHTLLRDGGRAAIQGPEALDALLAVAAQAGYTMVGGSERSAPALYVEVNPKLRQVFVAGGIINSQGRLAGVHLVDPGRLPTWVDVSNWPGVPSPSPSSRPGGS